MRTFNLPIRGKNGGGQGNQRRKWWNDTIEIKGGGGKGNERDLG